MFNKAGLVPKSSKRNGVDSNLKRSGDLGKVCKVARDDPSAGVPAPPPLGVKSKQPGFTFPSSNRGLCVNTPDPNNKRNQEEAVLAKLGDMKEKNNTRGSKARTPSHQEEAPLEASKSSSSSSVGSASEGEAADETAAQPDNDAAPLSHLSQQEQEQVQGQEQEQE